MSNTLVQASPGTPPSAKWEEQISETGDNRVLRGKPDWTDLVFFLVLVAGAVYAIVTYPNEMDIYEKYILAGSTIFVTWIGWLWRPLRVLMIACGVAALLAIGLYDGNLAQADNQFLLKYLLSSQSAILWMCALFFMATVVYWLGYISPTAAWMGTAFTWAGVFFGFTGLLVRWREGHLIAPDMGHIPVSNLYEVFVLFCLITAVFYLYYEKRYNTRALGGFVLLVISAAVIFLLWYTFERDAAVITPLNNALRSWWMKLHVPANFIGYGTFALAAMVGFAYLVKQHGETVSWKPLVPLLIIGGAMVSEPFIFSDKENFGFWILYFGIGVIIVACILLARKTIASKLPPLEILDDIMYRAISVGFAFFTVATVLGALWAADAWGTYWQWDPKETWAFIVWLNYAAWLHLRLMKGMRGTVAAYWALAGLIITSFAFLGVNIFLSGLHSYGEL
ncbi:c-type cytochrome biogenesis protein CcsB [Advenella sp. WQ 585]|uniref:C-type cytochrome biogenesis protein CcsB n=1 Tax=Advenella mandrilli TaxID=2800330 RepID=A0ABS1EBS8_9BURK|nr:c-type cytochrome biogenesis protein CcsB [Advenella mandrilli]MBK1781382.1 c-type cytochrome biogenesis protein CcsB [Advenella mandrilli]